MDKHLNDIISHLRLEDVCETLCGLATPHNQIILFDSAKTTDHIITNISTYLNYESWYLALFNTALCPTCKKVLDENPIYLAASLKL